MVTFISGYWLDKCHGGVYLVVIFHLNIGEDISVLLERFDLAERVEDVLIRRIKFFSLSSLKEVFQNGCRLKT